MRKVSVIAWAAAAVAAVQGSSGWAQDEREKLVIGAADRIAVAPLMMAAEEGMFEERGLDVEVVLMPPAEQAIALRRGSVQAVASTVDALIAAKAAGVELVQVLVLAQSDGADALVVDGEIQAVEDLAEARVVVSEPGTPGYLLLAAILDDAAMTVDDLLLSSSPPKDAAFAFLDGVYDGAVTYEPFLGAVRASEDGRVLASSADYPLIVDVLAFAPELVAAEPATVDAVVRVWSDAVGMMNDEGAYAAMAGQTGRSTADMLASAGNVVWQDVTANQSFLADRMGPLMEEIVALQMRSGIVDEEPALDGLTNDSFVRAVR